MYAYNTQLQMIKYCMCVNDGVVKKSRRRKIHGSFCETEHYLEKVAADCHGIKAVLLCGDWAMGLSIVYKHTHTRNIRSSVC